MKNAKKIAWRRIASGLSVVGALGAFWVAAGAPPFAWI